MILATEICTVHDAPGATWVLHKLRMDQDDQVVFW